ncbi:MAG: hypothetical protein PHR38_09600 [Bacteroidales bacterium]|nr:hypothetical protein [Bacteroidales bacterium]
MKINCSCLILLFLFVSSTLSAGELNMKISGDTTSGFYVDLFYGTTPISTPEQTGELNLYVENEDYSIREYVNHWKATSAIQKGNTIILSGIIKLNRLETDLSVSVIYEKINKQVVEKRMELLQTNLSLLYYSVNTSLCSKHTPSAFWSFDDADNKGGVAHETFPAAGYMIGDTLAVGLLTDAGNRNLWTRNIRRRPSTGEIGFRAIQEICDANLYRVATMEDRSHGKNFVQLTFGELSDFNHPTDEIYYKIPEMAQWESYNGAEVTSTDSVYIIQGKKAVADVAGFRLPYQLPDGFYTVRFKHRSGSPFSLRFFKNDGTANMDVQGFHYQTNIPSFENKWTSQEETVFLANTEGQPTNLLMAASNLKTGDPFKLEIKDLDVIQSVASERAYHQLRAGVMNTKRTFIFAVPAKPTLHDVRLASQVCLADGLHFQGTTEEKCLYACYQMLMWITSADNFTPLSVPSINYAPDMYNRDSFWSQMGVFNQESSEKIFNAWAATQNAAGTIGTIITPCMGSKELKGNDATLEFLWFALVNKRQYGTPLPMDKISKAFGYCIRELDPDGDGICNAHFVLGQNDCVEYPNTTSALAVNQGMLAVTLRVAQELGMPVQNAYVEKANAGYRAFYDRKLGYLVDNKLYPYVITFNALLPEFVSLWLFNEPILTSEMVNNTLDKVPAHDGYSPLIFHVTETYFTQKNKPFSPNLFWDNGIYYNAGSWMREEICGYVAGLKHGWKPAEKRIKDRMIAEITLNPDEPFSHEFLPYDLNVPNCWWPSTRVFSWNVFVLKALEVAGMRTPEQDPGFIKNNGQ